MPLMTCEITVSSLDPGGVVARFKTISDFAPPILQWCYHRIGTAGLSAVLNEAGVAYFASQADAVNAAIAEALTDAQSHYDGQDLEVCDGECFGSGNSGGGAYEEAAAGATITAPGVSDGDIPPCVGPAAESQLTVTARAPGGVTAVDLNEVLGSAIAGNFENPETAGTIIGALQGAGGIATWNGTAFELYVDFYGGAYARISLSPDPIAVSIVGKATPSSPVTFTDAYLTLDYEVMDQHDSRILTASSMSGTTGIVPGSLMQKIFGPDIEITESVLLVPGTTHFEPATNSEHLTFGGSLDLFIAPYFVVLDPGNQGSCECDISYVNPFPFNPSCDRVSPQYLYLWYEAPTGFKITGGLKPACRIPIYLPRGLTP